MSDSDVLQMYDVKTKLLKKIALYNLLKLKADPVNRSYDRPQIILYLVFLV